MHYNPLFSVLAGARMVSAWSELHHAPIMNKNIDAIVVPGTYASHMHTFFGSDAITNVLPTSADLQKGCYSGDNPNDLSAYWIPTLYHVDGDTFTEVPVFRFSTYYTNAFADTAIPQNFAMVSGNASAKTQAEADNPYNGLEWFCEGSETRESDIAKLPTSTCDQHLQVNLRFPQCFSPDDHSEYDFADESNNCPEGMSRIPQLRYRVQYDTKSVAPNGWNGAAPFQLSCSDTPGDGYCFHADFINGWFEDAAENMLITGGGGYNDGQFIAGEHGFSAVQAACTPTDQDPDNGTSDYYTSLEMMADGMVEEGPVQSATVVVATSTLVVAQTAMSSTRQSDPALTGFVEASLSQVMAPTQSTRVPSPTENGSTGKRTCNSKSHMSQRSSGPTFRKAAAKRVLQSLDTLE